MLLSKQKFDELCFEYRLTESDVERACDLLHDLLAAEADLTEEKYPGAYNITSQLNAAAYRLFEVGGDIAGDVWDDE